MEKQYHIGFGSTHGAEYAILPGDPGRVEKIAQYLDNAVPHAQNREYKSWLGELSGKKVLIMSTGIGGPSTAIAVEELYQTGVRTCIRIGTCGAMQPEIIGGDLIVANAAIRMDGTSREYVPIEYPAVSSFEVTSALKQAAINTGAISHVGVVQCKDSFYGQHSPSRMPIGYELEQKWNAWIKAGCLASEMESATLYIVGSTLRMQVGCVLNVIWNQERARLGMSNPECHDISLAIKTSVEAVRLLILQNHK